MSAKSVRGMLTLEQLGQRVEAEEIETVLTVFPDLYGRLLGKRITGHYFMEAVARHGMHACNYLLACDMEMDPVPGYAYTSWEKGYGDFHCVPDWTTLRRVTWLDKSALVFCDILDETTGEPVSVAPRQILRRQMERADQMGYTTVAGSELELFVLQESYSSAQAKGYADLQTFGSYIEDYHMLQGAKEEPLISAIRYHMDRSGVPVEFSKGEWGPGQHEINLRYADCLEMADRHALYKQGAKEIAWQQDLAVTFMAKWDETLAGSSMHVHLSLRDKDGAPLFAGDHEVGSLRVSDLFRWFLGGWIAHAKEITAFYAPYPTSYKRFQAGSFAPISLAWSLDNRTAGFRIVGHGASLRIECRIPGADANPYLAFAATLAAGLDGIENRVEPPPAFAGDGYAAAGLPRVPRTLNEAIAAMQRSDWLRATLGDEVMEHYLHYFRTEQRKFDEVVTTWERARYFERA